jgi:hypothetical protein
VSDLFIMFVARVTCISSAIINYDFSRSIENTGSKRPVHIPVAVLVSFTRQSIAVILS